MNREAVTTDRVALKEAKRRRKIMFRRAQVILVLCAALAIILYLLSAFVLFRVQTINITGVEDENGNVLPGSSYYNDDEIIQASGIATGESLVRMSKSDVKASIERALPYIGNVTVKRQYPSTVKIIVEDASAAFSVENNGEYILLNENYKVLLFTDKKPDNCAVLKGLTIKASVAGEKVVFKDNASYERITTLRNAFSDSGLDNITEYDLSNIANVKVIFNGKITIVVGTITDLSDKLSLVVKTIKAETENKPDARIVIDVTNITKAHVWDDYSSEESETYEEETSALYSDENENDVSPDDENDENNNDNGNGSGAVG